MNSPDSSSVLQRQLLQQLGDRLRRLRKAQRLGTVEMARRVGISRTTLAAVEAGDPAPSIGTYLRVMAVLGIGGDLALLAGDVMHPAPADSAAARSRRSAPQVQVLVSTDTARHQAQDLQSLVLHEEAVRRVRADPALHCSRRRRTPSRPGWPLATSALPACGWSGRRFWKRGSGARCWAERGMRRSCARRHR